MCIRDRYVDIPLQHISDDVLKSMRRGVTAERTRKLLHKLRKEIPCLLYTSDAADERSSVDLGGRRIIKKKKNEGLGEYRRDKTDTRRQ